MSTNIATDHGALAADMKIPAETGAGGKGHVKGDKFAAAGHTHTKADVGLSVVDNTADSDKPISTAAAAKNASQDGDITALQGDTHTHANKAYLDGLDTEFLQDLAAAMLQGGTHTNVTITYNDTTGTIDLSSTAGGGGLDQEQVEDVVGSLVNVIGSGISVTYDDVGNQLSFTLTGESFTTAEKNAIIANTAKISYSATAQAEMTANNAKVTNATHTGDVTGDTALTVTDGAVTNAKLADAPTNTVKGRVAAGTGPVKDLTQTELRQAAGINSLTAPAQDSVYLYDQSAGATVAGTVGRGLSITGTEIAADVESDPSAVAGAQAVTNFMFLTEAQFQAIATPDANTVYMRRP